MFTCIRTISAPASARAMAAAWPIPLVPPVTRAVCPSRENIWAVADAMLCIWRPGTSPGVGEALLRILIPGVLRILPALADARPHTPRL